MYKAGSVDIFCLIHLIDVSVWEDNFLPRCNFRHSNCRNLPSTLTSRSMWLHAKNLGFENKLPLQEKSWKPELCAHLNNFCEYPFLLCLLTVLWTTVRGLKLDWNTPPGHTIHSTSPSTSQSKRQNYGQRADK